MLIPIAVLVLPPLLIFGVYHLALWGNLLGMARMPFWRRMALASGVGHLLLAAGFFLLLYLDFRSSVQIVPSGRSFEAFLINRSGFWQALLLFDSLPGVLILGIFEVLARTGRESAYSVPLILGVVAVAGTFQWFWVGAALGAVSERLWSGLKTPDDDLPDWM